MPNRAFKCTLHEFGPWQLRRLRLLSIAVTVLCVELMTLALLFLGWGIFESFGVTVATGVAYLAFPSLLALIVLTLRRADTTIRAIIAHILDRETYRFRLTSLLLAVLLLSIVFGWYGHRSRRERSERLMLEGRWQAITHDGSPIVLPSGEPLIVEFAGQNFTVDPSRNPKWLDFHSSRGTTHAIYRWEGRRLRIVQVSAGIQRPTSFDQDVTDCVVKPGANVTTFSMSTSILEPLPPQAERHLTNR